MVVTVPIFTVEPSLYVMLYGVLGFNPVSVIEPFDNPHPDGFTNEPIANIGFAITVIETVSVEFAQGLLAIDHWKIYVPAVVNPVIVVAAELGVVIDAAGPLICVHVPDPITGVFADIVAVPTLEHTD